MAHPIVLGYDGSAWSTAALDEAVELVRGSLGTRVVLVYCHEPPPGLACALDPACAAAKELRDYERRLETEVEPMLERAAARIRETGVECEVLLVWDDPVRALPDIARERGSRVIVVGSRGKSSLRRALGRHTSLELVYRSDIPVMVVPLRS